MFSSLCYYTVTYLIGISTVCHIRALSDLYHMFMGDGLYASIRVSQAGQGGAGQGGGDGRRVG